MYLCRLDLSDSKMEENKIVIYQTEDGQTQIDVRLENETVWLTQAQMVELFQTTKQNVSLHLNNLYKEGELEKEGTVKEYLTVQQEGKRKVSRKVKYYDLDVIISVGYRDGEGGGEPDKPAERVNFSFRIINKNIFPFVDEMSGIFCNFAAFFHLT